MDALKEEQAGVRPGVTSSQEPNGCILSDNPLYHQFINSQTGASQPHNASGTLIIVLS